MGLLDDERQRRIVEEARRAARASIASIQPAADSAMGVHRVDLGDEPMRITPGDYGDPQSGALARMADGDATMSPPPPPTPQPVSPAMSGAMGRMLSSPTPAPPQGAMARHLASPWVTDVPGPVPAPPPPLAAPSTDDFSFQPPDMTSAAPQREVEGVGDAVPQARDYGAQGQQLLDQIRASRPGLARDDAEPIGDVGRPYGAQPGQMVAPSGAAEGWDQRFARLGVGGDFSPSIPPAHLSESTSEPGERILGMLRPDRASALASPVGDGRVEPAISPKPPVDAAREAAAGPLPRLDVGLPSEADIAAAHEDPGHEILRRIGNALRGAIGQSAVEAPTEDRELAAERRAGLRSAMAGKAQGRTAERTAAQAAARQSTTDEATQRRLDLMERDVTTRERTAEALTPERAALLHAQTGHTQASTQTETGRAAAQAFENATTAERDDEHSRASDAMRVAVAEHIDSLPPSIAAQLRTTHGDLSVYDANELRDIEESLPSVSVRARTGASGLGGGAVSAGDQALVDQYVARGIAESPEDASSQIAAIRAGGGNPATLLQGTIGEQTVAPPSPATQALMRSAMSTLGEMESTLARYPEGADIPGIGPLDAQMPDGAMSVLDPDGFHMRALRAELSDNVLRVESGAAVPDSEVIRMARRMPEMSEREFRASLPRVRRRLEEMQRTSRGSRTAPRRTPEGTPPAPAAPTSSSTFAPTVVTLPDGRRATARTQQAYDAAIAAGAR